MMRKPIVWAWLIRNSVSTICWTVLAIVFGKWWIALFAVLFLSDAKFHVSEKEAKIDDE